MAAEFYHKTAALFDEFKKRELLALNNEKELKSGLNWNHVSLSTQDYLKKISQREQEAEKTYKDLIKNMDELDRQTDQMTLKLEKLHALRTVAVSSSISTWPSVDDRPLESYYHRTLTDVITPLSSLNVSKPFQPVPNGLSKYSSCNQSTQTEYLFCAQCHFPITMLSTQLSENVKSGNDILDIPLHERSSTSQNASSVYPILTTKNESIDQHIDDIPTKSDPNSLQQTSDAKEDIPENNFSPLKSPIRTNSKCSQDFKNKEPINNNLTHLESSMEPVEESIEQPTLKSDDESMNHEFDFLESNKISMPKVSFQNNVENLDRTDVNNATNFEDIPATVPDFEKQTKPSNRDSYQSDYSNMSRIKVNENIKSESSVNRDYPTPLFSENASLASESDTLSEKDTPLTATAAYQALLGNAPSARTTQMKTISDSDSEDEIENVLATAVRKVSSVALESSETVLKLAKRKESEDEIKPKPEARGSISSSKPQSKLSKNTRKVLGLDTSSGSEMELALPNTSKKDEDSDEFDFYD